MIKSKTSNDIQMRHSPLIRNLRIRKFTGQLSSGQVIDKKAITPAYRRKLIIRRECHRVNGLHPFTHREEFYLTLCSKGVIIFGALVNPALQQCELLWIEVGRIGFIAWRGHKFLLTVSSKEKNQAFLSLPGNNHLPTGRPFQHRGHILKVQLSLRFTGIMACHTALFKHWRDMLGITDRS